MRSGAGLSVHATGYAADIQYKDEAQAREMWDWFLANSKALGLCELHWYAYGEYGAGYRCSRGEGKKGGSLGQPGSLAGKDYGADGVAGQPVATARARNGTFASMFDGMFAHAEVEGAPPLAPAVPSHQPEAEEEFSF